MCVGMRRRDASSMDDLLLPVAVAEAAADGGLVRGWSGGGLSLWSKDDDALAILF